MKHGKHHLKSRKKSTAKLWLIGIAICAMCAGAWKLWWSDAPRDTRHNSAQNIWVTVVEDGAMFPVRGDATIVEDFLRNAQIPLRDCDIVTPERNVRIANGGTIEIARCKEITVMVDGETKKIMTSARNLRDIFVQNDIAIGDDDIVEPDIATKITSNMSIIVTRVRTTEETHEEDISFATIRKKSDKLYIGEEKIAQKGVAGRAQVTYRITWHDDKEVSREEIARKTMRHAQDKIIEIGTKKKKVKLGKKHTGQASWYAYKGGMFAANPWLPKGSRVKVTNTANGKSVIVTINDRGPFVQGRIIDLDKVAFTKIASIGAGVINVIMEEVIE